MHGAVFHYCLNEVAQPSGKPIKVGQAEWLLEGRFPGWLHARKCRPSAHISFTYTFYSRLYGDRTGFVAFGRVVA